MGEWFWLAYLTQIESSLVCSVLSFWENIEITLRVEKIILSEIICYFAKGFSFAKSETEVVIFSQSSQSESSESAKIMRKSQP